ncbi:phage antirepressor Ant [Geobacillus thermoleovorans]|uniref:Prophage antirepressor n=1 Tax=Geobacillus phage phiOH2 TaxID=3378811 RepID=A0AC59HJF7_9VIRU|nr:MULTISPECIES: phage antirepressor KilAC domain-containing protein [Geobacillus thermoleovorans group]YP_008240357.1 antirepressor KilAC domain-containing protein [Thermus phage phi OH2]QDY71989.1 phage antirepressor Ant [Geobacillus thermoleovorans]BAN62928.1 prophage antirepressor [Thermus phage phi OH2]
MNQLQVFNHEMFGEIRFVEINNNPYAVGNDVAKALGYMRPHEAISTHCKGAVTYRIPTNGGEQTVRVIPEGDIYRLIIKAADQSKNLEIKKKAEEFERWVFDEILPTIRKTGGYVANEDMFINTYLPFADDQTKMMFRGVLETVRRQNEQIAAMKPKVEYFDALVDRNLLTNFRDTEKELKVKERFFINWLLQNKFVYRDQKGKLKPYAAYVPELFELKEWERNGRADVQTLITPKGRETFRLLLKKEQTA